jgi:translation initiation factor IF-3
VIDEDGAQLGIMPPFEALKEARGKGLDLVEVAPAANPPVCRIINYGKYLYQLNKRQHEARKHQKSIELKEVKFRPRTSGHDFEVKRNRIEGFLQDGSKVKATVMFRGRENAHREIGLRMLERLIEELSEVGQVESRPRQEGPTLAAILAPKKATGKSSGGKSRSSGESSSAPASARQALGRAEGTARAAATSKPTDSSGGHVG